MSRLKFWQPTLAIIIALTIIIFQPLKSSALTVEDISKIATKFTVIIDSKNPGSGAIIAKNGTNYYVLTAKHVIEAEEKYQVITPDNERYPIDQIKKMPNVDLAVLQFHSQLNYQVATVAIYENQLQDNYIFVSGWLAPSSAIAERIRLFVPGMRLVPDFAIASMQNPLTEGYQLFYTNITEVGMSGGAIVDTKGRLIGIHGRAEGEKIYDEELEQVKRLKLGFSSGIPIQTFFRQLRSLNLGGLQLNVQTSPPAHLTNRDINSIAAFLEDIHRTASVGMGAISWANYGNLMYRLDRLPEALTAFEKAIEIRDKFYQAWYARGVVLATMGKSPEAISAYDKALQINPKYTAAWRNRALALLDLGQYTESLVAFDRALSIQPDNYVLWYLRGNLLQEKLQQYESALASSDRAVQIKPDFALGWINRGRTLILLGRYQEALESVQKALQITPSDRTARELQTFVVQNIDRQSNPQK